MTSQNVTEKGSMKSIRSSKADFDHQEYFKFKVDTRKPKVYQSLSRFQLVCCIIFNVKQQNNWNGFDLNAMRFIQTFPVLGTCFSWAITWILGLVTQSRSRNKIMSLNDWRYWAEFVAETKLFERGPLHHIAKFFHGVRPHYLPFLKARLDPSSGS